MHASIGLPVGSRQSVTLRAFEVSAGRRHVSFTAVSNCGWNGIPLGSRVSSRLVSSVREIDGKLCVGSRNCSGTSICMHNSLHRVALPPTLAMRRLNVRRAAAISAAAASPAGASANVQIIGMSADDRLQVRKGGDRAGVRVEGETGSDESFKKTQGVCVDEDREAARRAKISAANKGKAAWNRGRQWSEGESGCCW